MVDAYKNTIYFCLIFSTKSTASELEHTLIHHGSDTVLVELALMKQNTFANCKVNHRRNVNKDINLPTSIALQPTDKKFPTADNIY